MPRRPTQLASACLRLLRDYQAHGGLSADVREALQVFSQDAIGMALTDLLIDGKAVRRRGRWYAKEWEPVGRKRGGG